MYKIMTDETSDRYADSLVFIRVSQNGSYVPCDRKDADGFCAKTAVETGEDGFALNDEVYALPGHTLTGAEPEGTYAEIAAAVMLAELDALEAAYDLF